MRIGIDCRSLQEPYPTGVSVYTRQLIAHLLALPDAAQHTFVLFLNGHRLRRAPEQLEALKVAFPGANVEWRVRSLPNKLFPALEVVCSWPSTEWMFGRVDVVFVPNLQFFPLRRLHVPLVLTMHDLSFERFPECLDIKGRWRHRLLQPRRFVDVASRVIAVSQHTADDMVSLYGVSPQKIQAVYPGILPVQTDVVAEEPLPLPANYMLFVSTIEPRKNVDALLDAFEVVQSRHPDMHLVIAGAAGWKSAQTVERMQRMAQVHWFGYVNEQQKRQLYGNARLFVYPSVYEGFGFPPLEAQQYGVPVIVGAHSSLPEVLQESALYVDVLDINSLTRCIEHLLTDEPLRQQLIQRGSQNVQRFSWTRAAEQTLQILTSL